MNKKIGAIALIIPLSISIFAGNSVMSNANEGVIIASAGTSTSPETKAKNALKGKYEVKQISTSSIKDKLYNYNKNSYKQDIINITNEGLLDIGTNTILNVTATGKYYVSDGKIMYKKTNSSKAKYYSGKLKMAYKGSVDTYAVSDEYYVQDIVVSSGKITKVTTKKYGVYLKNTYQQDWESVVENTFDNLTTVNGKNVKSYGINSNGLVYQIGTTSSKIVKSVKIFPKTTNSKTTYLIQNGYIATKINGKIKHYNGDLDLKANKVGFEYKQYTLKVLDGKITKIESLKNYQVRFMEAYDNKLAEYYDA